MSERGGGHEPLYPGIPRLELESWLHHPPFESPSMVHHLAEGKAKDVYRSPHVLVLPDEGKDILLPFDAVLSEESIGTKADLITFPDRGKGYRINPTDFPPHTSEERVANIKGGGWLKQDAAIMHALSVGFYEQPLKDYGFIVPDPANAAWYTAAPRFALLELLRCVIRIKDGSTWVAAPNLIPKRDGSGEWHMNGIQDIRFTRFRPTDSEVVSFADPEINVTDNGRGLSKGWYIGVETPEYIEDMRFTLDRFALPVDIDF